jgi:hypothetical protein
MGYAGHQTASDREDYTRLFCDIIIHCYFSDMVPQIALSECGGCAAEVLRNNSMPRIHCHRDPFALAAK